MRKLAAVLGVWILSAIAAAAAPASREIAFVSNAGDGTVSLLDVASRKVLGVIDINPAHIRVDRPGAANYAQDSEISPDGRTLYVSRGYLGDVAAFDIATRRLIWKSALDTPRADHMTLSPDGRAIFISALADDRVVRMSAVDGKITGSFATGVWPHENKFSKDGRRLYNSSLGEIASLGVHGGAARPTDPPGYPYQLTIADPVTLKVMERIKLDAPFRIWEFTPDETAIYTQLSNQRVIAVYDLGQQKVVRRLELPFTAGKPIADWELEAPLHGLALTRDGHTLCVAGRESDYVALVRAPQLSLITTVSVGKAPGWAEIADHGRLCLVPNAHSDDVSFVSIPDRAELARVAVGKDPKHLQVASIPMSVIAAFESGAKP